MRNKYLLPIVLMFFSCKNEEKCDLISLVEVRENSLDLNSEAERSLNNLTHVMNASVNESDYSGEDVANYTVNKLYFQLNNQKQVFWFVIDKYKNRTQSQLMYRNIYSIDLEDMTPDNIYYDNETLSPQSIGIVSINSKNNNPKGVKLKGFDYTEGDPILSYCEYRSGLDLSMAPHRAKEFVEEINAFLTESSRR